jgi:hypothetical protein
MNSRAACGLDSRTGGSEAVPSPQTETATGYSSGAVPKSSCLDSGALEGRTGGLKADCPQAEPATGFTLHLPLPPSVNSIVNRLGNCSPNVRKWIRLADPYILAIRGSWPKPLPVIKQRYSLEIIWPEKQFGMFDCDNRIKVLQDYLQRIMLIDNDRNCWRITAEFGDVERGMCLVKVTAL